MDNCGINVKSESTPNSESIYAKLKNDLERTTNKNAELRTINRFG